MALLLSRSAALALSAPLEVTLRTLLQEYDLDSGPGLLISVVKLVDILNHHEINCIPPLDTLGIDDVRVLSPNHAGSIGRALEEIGKGETGRCEFKSSLLFDHRKYSENPGLNVGEYRLDALIHSALKTVAAFCNTDGGILYLGVADDGTVCGLMQDFRIANAARGDFDGWEQFLRGQVESRFLNGSSVNAYLTTDCLTVEGMSFVRLSVARRSELTFLRKPGGQYEIFLRSGTRSISVPIEDIPKHYKLVRMF